MSTYQIDSSVLSDASWWHWALTVPLLAAYLAGVDEALAAAITLCAVMAILFWARLGGPRPMPAQVRIVYLVLLAIGTVPGMGWLVWVQLVGTSAMVTVGYCPLVRMLTLLPWNRSQPLAWSLLKNLVLVSAPGGLWKYQTTATPPIVACSCSLHKRRTDVAGSPVSHAS